MDLYSRFLGILTYRQRFMLAALFYFLSVPYASYIAFITFNFWIRQFEWQQQGDIIQKEMNSLTSLLAIRQEQTGTQLMNHRPWAISPKLDQSITEYFSRLKLSKPAENPNTYFLGNGFSVLKEPSINIEPIELGWKELEVHGKKLSFEENNEEHQAIINLLHAQLIKLGYSYALFQGRDLAANNYSRLVLIDLPSLEELIKQLVIRSKLIIASNEGENYTLAEIIALVDRVKKIQQEIENRFNDYFEELIQSEHYTNSELVQVKKSVKNFSKTIVDFLDIISNNQSLLANETPIFENIVNIKRELLRGLIQLQQPFFQKEIWQLHLIHYAFIFQFVVAFLIIFGLVKFHGLSSHLTALRDHIRALAEGKLSHCFTSQGNDAFGKVGQALDRVVEVIGIIMEDLISLSKQIEETTVRVSWAVEEQEKTLREQELIIKAGKKTAQDIAEKAQFLSTLLNEICESSQLTLQAQNANEGLIKMRDNMNTLALSSKEFFSSFDFVADQVQNMQKKVYFLDRLGDHAKMLSLNEKIENANIVKSAGNFAEITDKTELFSDNSEQSTSEIKKIIKDVYTDVELVRGDAERCFSEIRAGVAQLNLVSDQLGEIAKLGEDQQLKFLRVDEVMKMQASISQDIISNIMNLLNPADENILLVQELPKILNDIIMQQKKLTDVVKKMVYIP